MIFSRSGGELNGARLLLVPSYLRRLIAKLDSSEIQNSPFTFMIQATAHFYFYFITHCVGNYFLEKYISGLKHRVLYLGVK